ncbi:MAG: LPS export ABC transporter permease LptF [Acidobacteriaceae bacterium]|nr:LPS export ABC transporter permease LptF [Acidobacteriaceae bacterium]
MRIFTRYILREVIGYALLGGVLFTFILFMRYLLPLMELAVRGLAGPGDILLLIGYLLPNFLTLTIPMAVLIGTLLGLSRLAADSEVTAMRASGLGVTAFVRIVGLLAMAMWGIGLANTLYVAPRATQALLQYDDQAKNTTQAQLLVEPHVFNESFKNYVLYVQDVEPGANGTALWKHVFLADTSKAATPYVITAQRAVVLPGENGAPRIELDNGTRHDLSRDDPSRYDISTFATATPPMQATEQGENSHLTRRDTPLQAMLTSELWAKIHQSGDTRTYRIELQRRFSFPAACLVLMLVGVPLGLSSKRGGKGTGFVVTLFLVFVYYFASSMGIALARQGKVSPWLGVWGANMIFALAGLLLIQQMSRGGLALGLLSRVGMGLSRILQRRKPVTTTDETASSFNPWIQQMRRALHSRFPLLLDEYVMSSFLKNFVLVLFSLTVLFLIFTFFELIGDIIKYRTPLVTVGDYLLNLIPFILYNVTPICSLVAVLVTFGTLNRTSELTAMKATGTSLYRVIAPVLLVAAMLSVALFAFDEVYLPAANRRQDALLATIKGKPAQTYLRPDRKWMSGQSAGSTNPNRIFYYQFFGQDTNVFANLTVFEFEPGTFKLRRRIFAASTHWDENQHQWVFENGWERTFAGETIASYRTFNNATFHEIHEQPSYFKKEDRQSQQMSFTELRSYIHDLQQSGFDTMRLRVQLNRKLAYPLITLILAMLAIPFSLQAGKRGSIAGMSAAVGLVIAYWVVAGIMENLGNVNSLPAVLAAWSPDLLFAFAGGYLLLRTPT